MSAPIPAPVAVQDRFNAAFDKVVKVEQEARTELRRIEQELKAHSVTFLPKLPPPPLNWHKGRSIFATWPWLLRPGDRLVTFREDMRGIKVDTVSPVGQIERPSPGRGCTSGNVHIDGGCYSRHLPLFYIPRKENHGANDGSEESAA